jgi:enhancing lycopene biosynthesis protein 2
MGEGVMRWHLSRKRGKEKSTSLIWVIRIGLIILILRRFTMKNIAIVLSGCGVNDGSEIHESVLTMLAVDRNGAKYQCLAPNMIQNRVFDHAHDKEVANEQRNVFVEAGRIARGNIKDLKQANPADYDAVIFPGGYGVALNLCDFAVNGEKCTVQPDVLHFAKAIAKQGKPAGYICIAPSLIAAIYGPTVQLTIGNDKDTARKLNAMGNHHVDCTVDNIIIDAKHKVVTTPAYMLAKSISEAATGIEKLVKKIIELC